jgi:hypothetical protein
MIEDAIVKRIAANEKEEKSDGLQPEDFLGKVSAEKLREFIITQAKYNTELYNAVLLEFSSNAGNTKGNKYSKLIQKILASVDYDEGYYDNDYYDEEGLNIDALDQWIDKAQKCVQLKQYDEAILICKAIIEESSQWLYNIGDDISQIFSPDYQSVPFDIIIKAAEHADKKELFNYCLSEIKKKKYKETDFYDGFQRLFEDLAIKVDPDAFIAFQDKLLAGEKDKSSYEAETILRRKINFYRRLDEKKKAWDLIKENIQIESFRMKVAKRKIEKQNFQLAKKLISDFINSQKKDPKKYIDDRWIELLLDIAQKEKDIPAIRELSYKFIEDSFNKEHYQIYKAAFSPAEWADEREKLFLRYSGKKRFSYSAADLLAVENEIERLLNYVEKYLSMNELERYYKIFAPSYPEKTLEMFKKVLIPFAANNMGRSCYEQVLSVLKKMSQIKGGKKAASELVADFKIRYKNRRAMMEILGKF